MFFEGFIWALIKTDKILLTIENYPNHDGFQLLIAACDTILKFYSTT